MDDYLRSNQELWNNWTRIHVASIFYDVDGFKAGKIPLDAVVREGVGNVTGKSLLHLQCHFGIDTLSWARLGARVTGADFSDEAIAQARALAKQVGIDANFVCCNLYDLPSNLSGQFDIVFTSHGVITWLPDIPGWARIIAHFLKPGGLFFITEAHPTAYIFDDENPSDLRVRYPYFPKPGPDRFEVKGSYAEVENGFRGVEYAWAHSLSEITNALIAAGLQIVELREYPFLAWRMFSFMEQRADGWWHLPDRFPPLPLMFSLKATADHRPKTAEKKDVQ